MITVGPLKASPLPPPSARGVTYRVPVEVKTDEHLQALQAQHVKFVKRFQVRSADTSEHKDKRTFFTSQLQRFQRNSECRIPNIQGPSVHTEAGPLFKLQSLRSGK